MTPSHSYLFPIYCPACKFFGIAALLLALGASAASAQDYRSSLILGPYSLSFGDVLVGKQSDPQTITLISTAAPGALIDKITVTGDFNMSSDCPAPPALLARNQTCGIEVAFKPETSAPASGTVSVFHDHNPVALTVSLTGAGALNSSSVSFSPPSLDFSEQGIGTPSAPRTVTFSNTGQKTLLISGIGTEGDFTIMPASTCESLVGSLAPAADCTVVVTFTPLGPGKRAGAVVFRDDAEDSPQRVVLSGVGKQQ